MRARLPVVLAVPLLASAWGCAGGSGPAPTPTPAATSDAEMMRPLPSPLPMVAGRVNGQDIPIRHVAIMVEESIELGRVSESRRNALYREALDQLVKRELLLQEAEARGVTADPVAVQRAYDQLRGHYRNEEDWKGFLKGRSLDDDLLRTELRVRHTVQALLEQEAAQHAVSTSEEELRALYDRTDPKEFHPEGASPAPKPPFEAVRGALNERLLQQKHAEASDRFVESLRARAKIEKYL
jgi:hypothetical protein